MAQKKKIPEIRFKEFTDSWSDQPLSYYLAVSEEKNSANQYDKYDIYSVSREYGVINQIEYQGKSFAGASLLNYRVVNPNEVVYTKSPLRAQPYGIIKTNKPDSGIVSALYGVFKPNEEVDPIFVQTYFELDSRLNEYLRPLVNKGAKNTLLISDEDSISGNVSFPKKEEQEKMVKLFNAIDKLIRKLEEKLEKLAQIFNLSREEKDTMYNLVGQKRDILPPDYKDYVIKRDYVSTALRTARDLDAGEEEWQRFVDELRSRKG